MATAVAVGVGLIVLLAFFLRHPLLNPLGTAFAEWTVILAAFALLLGLVNLLTVHLGRVVRRNEPGAGYSLIILVTSAAVIAVGLLYGLPGGPMLWIFDNVYIPLQSSFLALLVFLLATAAFRAFRARSLETALMLLAALIVFLGQVPWFGALADAREWVLSIPSTAGMRGILLGVALGATATALRLIVGLDRPYSE
ncbi:MAG: hypothetical protein M1482_06780 [Chloroflexi bacterium]|nr:hypothetical protein [Chloroflexota bacterium]